MSRSRRSSQVNNFTPFLSYFLYNLYKNSPLFFTVSVFIKKLTFLLLSLKIHKNPSADYNTTCFSMTLVKPFLMDLTLF